MTAAEFLEYLIDDPATTAIGGFIEAVRDPGRFGAALDRAAAANKPVAFIKVSPTKRRARFSHTAGDAGDPTAFSEMLRAHRAIEVRDHIELTELLAACQGAKQAQGRRIGVIMSSGGMAEMMLDIAAEDLRLPPLPPDLRADIDRQVGYITGDGIPLDAWGNGTFVPNLDHGLAAFQGSPDHDAVVFVRDNGLDQPMDQPETALNYLAQFARAARATSRITCFIRGGQIDPAHVECLHAAIVSGIREGLGAIDDKLAALGRLEIECCVREGDDDGRYRGAVRVDDKVAIITLNRPDKLNAISHELMHGVLDGFTRAEADKAVSVVLLRAEGRSFCADRLRYRRQARRTRQPAEADDWRNDPIKAHQHLAPQLAFEMTPWHLKKPVIASVQGHVMAAAANS